MFTKKRYVKRTWLRERDVLNNKVYANVIVPRLLAKCRSDGNILSHVRSFITLRPGEGVPPSKNITVTFLKLSGVFIFSEQAKKKLIVKSRPRLWLWFHVKWAFSQCWFHCITVIVLYFSDKDHAISVPYCSLAQADMFHLVNHSVHYWPESFQGTCILENTDQERVMRRTSLANPFDSIAQERSLELESRWVLML